MRTICCLIALSLTVSLTAIEVGSKAPAMNQVQWLQGSQPDLSKQVTIVELWATWCGPCVDAIPHLSQLNTKHGDKLAVMGLSQERKEVVEPFIKKQGAAMNFPVGIANTDLYQT